MPRSIPAADPMEPQGSDGDVRPQASARGWPAKFDRWIYVTGAPRSCTTFVGKVLSLDRSVDYIHEPFNPDCGIEFAQTRFMYRSPERPDPELDREVEKILAYRFSLRTGYFQNDSQLKKVAKFFVGSRGAFYLRLAKVNPFHRAAVIKDPIGCLLTGYLAAHHGLIPVIVVRHPVAFVASVLRLRWDIDLGAVLRQDDLVRDHGFGHQPLQAATEGDRVEQAAWLWRLLNQVLQDQIADNPQWIVIRHEDIGTRPQTVFKDLYERLGLQWSDKVSRYIERATSAENKREAGSGRVQDFRRDSAGLLDLRIESVSLPDRSRIFDITWPIARRFYSERSYRLDFDGTQAGAA